MFYEIEVRPAPGMDFFQYYTVTVEAPTSHDALQRVQRSNPGCMLSLCGSYQSNPGSGGGGSSSSGDSIGVGGILVLVVVLFAIWLFVEYTSLVLMGVLGLAGAWIGQKFESKTVAFILAIALGAFGFYLGTDWSYEVDGANREPQQVEDSRSILEPEIIEDSRSILEPSLKESYYFPDVNKIPLEDSSTVISPEIVEPTDVQRRQMDCGDGWGRRRRC